MKVKILYSYSVSVIPPRCRNPRNEVRHDGECVVEIREVPDALAPVALQAFAHKTRKRGDKYVDGRERIDYRWFEGHLWTNCRLFNVSRSAHTSGKSDWNYVRPPATMDMRDKGYGRVTSYRQHLTVNPFDSKEEIEKQLHDWAASWLILEGQRGIWATAREPRYVAMTFGLGCNHGGSALMLDDHFNSNISKDRYFTAMQFAEAKAYATKMAKERGDTKSLPIKPHGRIKVLLPDAVRCRPQVEAGDGDPFINQMDDLSKLQNPVLAGMLGIAAVMSSSGHL